MSSYGRGNGGWSQDPVDLHKNFKYLLQLAGYLFLDHPQKQVRIKFFQSLQLLFKCQLQQRVRPNQARANRCQCTNVALTWLSA